MHPRAPERIAKNLPSVRCIAVLRNPIERAFSNYKMEVKRTAEKRTFEESIESELKNGPMQLEACSDQELYVWNSGLNIAYLTRGIYVDQIRRWWSVFPKDQLMIVLSDDLFFEPAVTYQKITDFIGVEPCQKVNFVNLNEGGYQNDMSSKIRAEMQEFFKPYNEQLAQELGREIPWT